MFFSKNCFLDIGKTEDLQTMNDKQLDGKKNLGRFKDKSVQLSKDANVRFDDYFISPKITNNLLLWGYELIEDDSF